MSNKTNMDSTHTVRPLCTCVVGGGNSAHILIPVLTEAGHRVHLLTRRPDDWKEAVYCEVTDALTNKVEETHVGHIDMKSADPADVIPDADIIILCMPVHTYRVSLDRVAPYINRNKTVYIGTVFGQAGFNWMVHSDVEERHQLSNIVTFAIGSIPWICRTLEYGSRAANYGTKSVNVVAVTPADKFKKLEEILLDDLSYRPFGKGKFQQEGSFISLTMSVDNQIIHPARCYGLWQRYGGEWPSLDQVPYFYKDFDQLSADCIRKLDDDYTTVRNAIRKYFPNREFKFMLSYLELENLNHSSGKVDILSSLKDSKQLASIRTPTVEGDNGMQVLNTNCRFFTDDIPYGLLIAKWLAEKLNVETPFVDEVILWAQSLRGEKFVDEQTRKINKEFCLQERYLSGIPESYGITSLDDPRLLD